MSEHDELADRREQEANYLEGEAERNEQRAEEARDALTQAESHEFTPAALGDEDPAHREPSEAERAEAEEEENAPPPPSSPGEKVQASLDDSNDTDDSDDTDHSDDTDDSDDSSDAEDSSDTDEDSDTEDDDSDDSEEDESEESRD